MQNQTLSHLVKLKNLNPVPAQPCVVRRVGDRGDLSWGPREALPDPPKQIKAKPSNRPLSSVTSFGIPDISLNLAAESSDPVLGFDEFGLFSPSDFLILGERPFPLNTTGSIGSHLTNTANFPLH